MFVIESVENPQLREAATRCVQAYERQYAEGILIRYFTI